MKTNLARKKGIAAVALHKRTRTPLRRGKCRTPAPATTVAPLLRIKSILVPIDFSPSSRKALDYAIPFAEQFGAKLTLLYVVEPLPGPDFVNAFPLMMENDRIIAAGKAQLAALVRSKGLRPAILEKTLVHYGRSFNEIARAAASLKSDLIIISTHGHTGLKRAVLGSTTERVVRHAPCPVLVVREHEQEFV